MNKANNGKNAKLFLVDGTAFIYRAFYAIRELSNSKGEPTNAIYGFITMLKKLVELEKPDYFAICFDRREKTFRHDRYTEYKANRKPMPDDLGTQIQPIKEFCEAYRYPIFEKAGFEADDLLGTMAKRGEEHGFDVFVVTGDKDALQLVNERIKIMNPHKNNAVLDTLEVKKKFDGLGPQQVIDVMGLMGDSSDNIPGVPGVGEKTAIKYIKQFGSIEDLLKNIDKVKSKNQQNLLRENEEKAILSKELATIDTDVTMKIDWDGLKAQEPDQTELIKLLKRYEFHSLIKDLSPSKELDNKKINYQIIRTEKDLKELVSSLKKSRAFSFDTETTSSEPMQAELVGLSFSWKKFTAAYIPVSSNKHKGEGLPISTVLDALKEILEEPAFKKYGQNVKYDWIVLKNHGVTVRGITFDTMIASYLINPIKLNHNLDDISLEYLSVKKIPTSELLGSGKDKRTMDEIAIEQVGEYAAEDADCVYRLQEILNKKIKQQDLLELFEKLEMPLTIVLAKIEMNGVNLDLKYLKQLSENASEGLENLTKKIYKEAGEEFNINSPKQLSEILFVKMKLPAIKKTKTGFSTDVSVLERLSVDYDLPSMILNYREIAKLKSTYLDAIPLMINAKTNLIHTSYNQATTATGRLSSSDPNLQNIPIKTEEGRKVRKAFISRERAGVTSRILSADYSQIELRILAHLSGDKNLVKAFKEDRDVHSFTATLLYDVKEKDVTWEMRNSAKTINFSVIYGKTAFGLSQDLKISIPEADEFIKAYFKRYSGIKKYLEEQKETARKQGYLTTLLGRRSYFPEINSSNMMRRQFAERAAINAPIQGTAADVMKLAMLTVQRRLEKECPETFMIMQVHDELVFDVPEKDLEKATHLVVEEMEQAYDLKVPLKVDTSEGESWYKS